MLATLGASALPSSDHELDTDDLHAEDFDVDADDDASGSKPKKKRKLIKSGDKKYGCPHPDCGKAYSRAEHLYRHQLNRMLCCMRHFYTHTY